MRFTVVCAPGIGDALILHIVSHNLVLAGHEVTTVTPHRFGRWLANYQFGDLGECDAIFLQHDNSARSKEIHKLPLPVYTFYGSHLLEKHGPLRIGCDYVCDLNRSMVDNVLSALRLLFGIDPTADNGFKAPGGLVHRRFRKRVAIHATSGDPARNWPHAKFVAVAQWLASEGYEPIFLPLFPNLEDLASFVYESGYFLGNDSGPGHLASCLQIPHLIIGRSERHMRHWRPGWTPGKIALPPRWIPNWKGLRFREKHWKNMITKNQVIKGLKQSVLSN